MFERFTERARKAVVAAQEEARGLGCAHIDTEHLLLGLISVEDGVAARVLAAFGIADRGEVRARVSRGDAAPAGQIPFTPHAKKALELALREALSIGHNYIGTEHVLLGIARLNEGVTAEILPEPEAVRDKVIELLGAAKAIRSTRKRFGHAYFGARSSRPRWEYRVEERATIDAGWLNEVGAEGWMLAGVSGSTLILQRRCPPGELRAAG